MPIGGLSSMLCAAQEVDEGRGDGASRIHDSARKRGEPNWKETCLSEWRVKPRYRSRPLGRLRLSVPVIGSGSTRRSEYSWLVEFC
jgi:hypothetical protein